MKNKLGCNVFEKPLDSPSKKDVRIYGELAGLSRRFVSGVAANSFAQANLDMREQG